MLLNKYIFLLTGHPVLGRDGPIPEDCPVRQEGELHPRLHLPAAQRHARQSGAGRRLRHDAGAGRRAPGRHHPDCGRLHGAEHGAAVHRLPAGRSQEQSAQRGAAADPPPRDEPDGGATGNHTQDYEGLSDFGQGCEVGFTSF